VSKPPAKAAAASKTAAKTAKTTVPAPAPAPAPSKPAAKAAPATAAAKSSASKSSATKAPPQPAPPAPAPVPASNRFTDRFAPARPTIRPMTETADLPKTAHKADPKLVNAWKTKAGRDLTEEELLAMPEAEYMNEKQIDFFRARLQKQKDDLLSNAGETTEHLREDTSIVPDPADRATIEEEHALELRTRDRERKLLKKIAQSLGRLESGDYGFCDETGEPIGLARLMARPTATLSLEAQQRRELKQKMFGD
jgi:DnaK suppressor protein